MLVQFNLLAFLGQLLVKLVSFLDLAVVLLLADARRRFLVNLSRLLVPACESVIRHDALEAHVFQLQGVPLLEQHVTEVLQVLLLVDWGVFHLQSIGCVTCLLGLTSGGQGLFY